MMSDRTPSARICLVCLLVTLTTAVVPSGPATAEDFEQPPVFSAGDVVPVEVRKGAHYEVADEVPNDGFMNTYRINSDYGRFDAYGQTMLAVRVQEIGALDELAEVSKAKVFAESALTAITRPVTAIADFAERPGETIKGIGEGLGRMWKRTKRAAGEIKKDVQEAKEDDGESEDGGGDGQSGADKTADFAKGYAKKYFGATGAERRWAEKLGVDPYTSNETLRKAIREVARVDAAGSFGVKLVGMPSIPGADVVADVNQLVWGKDPGELKELNTKSLVAMGASEELIDRFFENPFFLSPSRQTRFVASLEALEGVTGRDAAVELAAGTESEAEAFYQLGAVIMLGWLHDGGDSLARLAPSRTIPVAVTKDGRLAVAAPLDYTVWTEDLAGGVDRLGELGGQLGAEGRAVWFHGDVSARCRSELEARGWKVHTSFESSR
ncbi:MAG: hypothetical protein GY719_22315 [bacterium]|nr:hypothetical protein [bacterium]